MSDGFDQCDRCTLLQALHAPSDGLRPLRGSML
jgi:hypothetical protein